MKTKVKLASIFHCSLERAFKTPILCDVSKVHTGYIGIMPKVTHCTDDQYWGKQGFSKKIFVAKSLTQKGGWAFVDKVTERIDNSYWQIELYDFQFAMFGFSKFVGEWKTTEMGKNKVLVDYTYTLHSDIALLYPLNWLFTKIFWKAYMKRVTENVREMTCNNEPYLYE